jgi:hypothetical protein
MNFQRGKFLDEKGVVVIFVAITIIVFIGIAALAVDIGYAKVARTELQRIADGAALAGARTLGRLYECNRNLGSTCPGPMPYQDQLTYVADDNAIRQAVANVASQNQAGSKSNISINSADIEIGNWSATTKTVDPVTLISPDAVKVTVRRDTSANGPITTFFAKVMGINTVNVWATATAALTGQSVAGPGGLPIPVGISLAWFQLPRETYCNQNIKFYPTGSMEGCSGWHTYGDRPANASKLARLLDKLRNGTYTSPETTAGSSVFDFTGGTIASAFDEMKALFEYMKTRDDDGNPNTWTTSVVVYNKTDCTNPNEDLTIVGFSTVVIHTVLESPEKTIVAEVKCDNVEPGRGGGGNYGTKGSIPGLVQ